MHFQDFNRNVFGAFLSSPNFVLHRDKYTGTPESFIFSFTPEGEESRAYRKYNYSGRGGSNVIQIFMTLRLGNN